MAADLKSIFKYGSKTFFALNCPLPAPEPKRDAPATLDAKEKRKSKSVGRATLRYRCCFVRPRDIDNLVASTKALTDGLRRCGLLYNDDPASLRLIVEQERIKKYADERIEIEISYDNQ